MIIEWSFSEAWKVFSLVQSGISKRYVQPINSIVSLSALQQVSSVCFYQLLWGFSFYDNCFSWIVSTFIFLCLFSYFSLSFNDIANVENRRNLSSYWTVKSMDDVIGQCSSSSKLKNHEFLYWVISGIKKKLFSLAPKKKSWSKSLFKKANIFRAAICLIFLKIWSAADLENDPFKIKWKN